MQKIQKVIKTSMPGRSRLGILLFGIAMLAETDLHAAKVCMADNLYYSFLNGYHNWYCHNSKSGSLSLAANTTNHGSGGWCWCFTLGIWSYSGLIIEGSSFCAANCAEQCGV
jgi:hypothetical protein